MSNLSTPGPKGNPSSIFEYFNGPLDRVEAQRATWLNYRMRQCEFEIDPSLDNEIALIKARDRWEVAFKARWS